MSVMLYRQFVIGISNWAEDTLGVAMNGIAIGYVKIRLIYNHYLLITVHRDIFLFFIFFIEILVSEYNGFLTFILGMNSFSIGRSFFIFIYYRRKNL